LVFAESAIGPTLNSDGFIDYKLECDLNNPCIPFKAEIIGSLDERHNAVDNEPIEEVVNVQIGDVVVIK
jgi:hypothetical protein